MGQNILGETSQWTCCLFFKTFCSLKQRGRRPVPRAMLTRDDLLQTALGYVPFSGRAAFHHLDTNTGRLCHIFDSFSDETLHAVIGDDDGSL